MCKTHPLSLISAWIFFLCISQIHAQNQAFEKANPTELAMPIAPLDYISVSSDRAIVQLLPNQINTWLEESSAVVSAKVYLPDLNTKQYIFETQSIVEKNCKVICVNAESEFEFEAEYGKQFSLWEDKQFKGNISIFNNEIYGHIFDEPGKTISYVPHQSKNSSITCSIQYEYSENFSRVSGACHTDDILHFHESEAQLQLRGRENCKRIPISLRADFDLFLKFNRDTQRLVNYLISAFNGVYSLYKKEDIIISIAEIFIHTSEDGFRHVTASEDLNAFRSRYRTFGGNVHYLISGHTKNGIAPLGGVAYINTICVKNYAYAYANVNGNFTALPAYSWDILVLTHELGHTLGSRHTHACVWGPNKNQAIDNCARVEGSCLAPPRPAKGTIMSYCHLTGQPGTDFSLGFGKEPGDLIRNTVQKAACLPSYTPNNKSINSSNQSIEANVECFDGTYSHYYFDNNTVDPSDDILIMSIAKNGQDIGALFDKSLKIVQSTTNNWGTKKAALISAPYTKNKPPFLVMNKFWNILSGKSLSKEIRIKYYYSNNDNADMNGSVKGLTDQMIKAFQILSPGDPNPNTNHVNTGIAQYKEFSFGTAPNNGRFIKAEENNKQYSLEFSTLFLTGGGIGFYQTGNMPNNGSNDPELQSEKISERNRGIYQTLVSPNPAQGFFTLQAYAKESSDLMYELIDMKGSKILQDQFNVSEGMWYHDVNIDMLNPGMYVLKLHKGNKPEVIRIIKE